MYDRFLRVVVLVFVVAAMSASAGAQQPADDDKLSDADLQTMLGPIALYPDKLLANVLTACVYPDEIVAAAQSVKAGTVAQDSANWEPSVQAVARAVDALNLLAEHIDWATAIGQAYMVQAPDVMKAIQSLRAKARANGLLNSNDYMTVVNQGSTIMIESPDPQVIYVPQYEPSVVYVTDGPKPGDAFWAGAIGFSAGVAVGLAMDDWDCQWHDGYICRGVGYADVDIDNNVNVNRGDRTVNNNNVNVNRGDRTVNNNNVNVNRQRKRDVQNTNIGREGQPFQPNARKVRSANPSVPRTDKLKQYGGVSSNKSQARLSMPQKSVDLRAPSGRAMGEASRPGRSAIWQKPQPTNWSSMPSQPSGQQYLSDRKASNGGGQASAFNQRGAGRSAANRGGKSRGGGRNR